MAPGESGELVIRGPQVMRGYWSRPEATAEAIVDGWFRTGDVATMDAEGYFAIVDRKKDMINTAGFKVWPREVEEALYAHPAVRLAAVVGVPDDYRGEAVKAFVVLKDDHGGAASASWIEFLPRAADRLQGAPRDRVPGRAADERRRQDATARVSNGRRVAAARRGPRTTRAALARFAVERPQLAPAQRLPSVICSFWTAGKSSPRALSAACSKRRS